MGSPASSRLLVAAALMVAVVVAVVAYRLAGDERGGDVEPRGSSVARDDGSPDADLRASDVEQVVPTRRDSEDRRAEALVETAADDANEDAPCVVRGVVVDERGAPLEGVLARLTGYGGWAEGRDVPALDVERKRYGWELVTGADGAFRFDAPTPTVVTTKLELVPGELRQGEEIYFSDSVTFARPALRAGERDVGAVQLGAAGVIRGVVRGADGLPIEGADLDVGSEPWNTISVGATADARGEYVVAHVPPGSWCLNVKADGFLPAHVKPLEVEAGLVTHAPDFALERAPTLAGRVTDAAGAPIADARVRALSTGPSASSSARTYAGGAFVLHLKGDEPHRLEVDAKGYAPGDPAAAKQEYAPGTDGIEIALAPDVLTRFVVVDEDGAPVELFGLDVERFQSRALPSRERVYGGGTPRPREHPGGVVELGARPGLDRFDLFAPGFEETSGEIEHDDGAPGVQTIRLSRGVSLVGRIVADGQPVAGAAVALTPGWMREQTTDDGATIAAFAEDLQMRAVTETGADGRFAFAGLDEGDAYALSASHGERGVLRLVPVVPEERGENDLGDLELAAPGSIAGRLVLPPGVAADGHAIYLDDWRRDVSATSDAAGRFRFDGVVPGEHTLHVDDTPGVLAAGAPFAVAVEEGETAEVALDCRDRAVAEVALRVDLGDVGDVDPEGWRVMLRPLGGEPGETGETYELGDLDADGRVHGFVRAGGEAAVEVIVWGYTTLVHPTARVPLPVGAQPERTIAFELGALELALPESVAIPAEAVLEIDVAGRGYRVRIDAERPPEPSPLREVLDGGRRFRLHLIPAGTHDLAVRLVDHAAEPRLVKKPNGGSGIVRPTAYQGAVPVAIEPGATTVVALP